MKYKRFYCKECYLEMPGWHACYCSVRELPDKKDLIDAKEVKRLQKLEQKLRQTRKTIQMEG